MTDVANVVAILTAHHLGGGLGAAEIILSLTDAERDFALGVAIGMLAREIELGCADAGMTVEEYLQIIGLAEANGVEL